MDESKLVYARLCELASQLHKPEAMSELRRLGALHRWEYEHLPSWVKEMAGLKQDTEALSPPLSVADRGPR